MPNWLDLVKKTPFSAIEHTDQPRPTSTAATQSRYAHEPNDDAHHTHPSASADRPGAAANID